jgi:glycosyltransferase involved in cell wall biosynthesis
MAERIAIVYPEANLDSVPSLCNAVDMLVAAGYKVDIFTGAGSDFIVPSFDHSSVELIFLRARCARQGIHRFIPGRWSYAFEALQRHLRSRYRCLIGVDPWGLVQAHLFSRFVRVPLIYYSLELYLSHELLDEALRKLKQREIELSSKVEFIIIQDEERAELLSIENNIPLSRFVLVPNAPLGPAQRRDSYYWHQRFGLQPHQKVVLHAGSLGTWTRITDIVDSVKTWPENWVLIVHTRFDAQHSDIVEDLQKRADPRRVFFSLKPVTRREYDILVDSAHIGIAFYQLADGIGFGQQNNQAVGLSSGKIAYYLRSGLPVIVNKNATISKILEREGCGIAVEDGADIGAAIAQIAQDYEKYSEQACRFFDAHLDFGRSFREVIKRIDCLE